MDRTVELEKLCSEEIVKIEMNQNRILHIWFEYPIIDDNVDYEVALYIKRKKEEYEAKNGKCLGLLVDISNYNRLNAIGLFDITVPSQEVRKLHSEMHEDAILRRVAFCKKNTSRVAEVAVKMAAIYHNKEVKLFSDKEKAFKWLKEGVSEISK